jgi:F-type H+-transporting ATPase subunit b
MRRLLALLLMAVAPVLLAQSNPSDASPSHRTAAAAHEANDAGHAGPGAAEGESHSEKTYLGIPAWILKLVNVLLFLGVLGYFLGGPVKKAFADRSAAIRQATEEARERRLAAERMASEIEARLAAIESEVRAIHERASAEGERQKREMIAAAEAESTKILNAARTEVDNRLKHARGELTAYAAQLAAERAESLLRGSITDQDKAQLFQESLRDVREAQS